MQKALRTEVGRGVEGGRGIGAKIVVFRSESRQASKLCGHISLELEVLLKKQVM